MYKLERCAMGGWVCLDTVYLSVKYPKSDVFRHWWQYAVGVDTRRLRGGVPAGGMLVRGGACGYSLSVWQGDARAFLTDQVDENRGDGFGMGIWVQLGPWFIQAHTENLSVGVERFLNAIGVNGDWPARVTRLDLAVDLPGVAMAEQEVDQWRRGWVGRAKVSGAFFNSRTGALETINVGSRTSPVFLRVYDKVAQAEKEGDLLAWREIWDGYSGPVCRVEWETKPSQAGFEGVADLEQYKLQELIGLGRYLVEWGRLCVPANGDSNRSRWMKAPVWERVEGVIEAWARGDVEIASRTKNVSIEPSAGYAAFLSGAISGGMARFGKREPSLLKMFEGLEGFGHSLEDIAGRADEKAAVLKALEGPQAG